MAIPFTLAQIKNHVSDVTYDALERAFTDADLEELSGNEGRTLEERPEPYNIRMGWHHDTAGKVNGIFLCRIDSRSLQAWRLIKDFDPSIAPYQLTVFQNHTTPATAIVIHRSLVDGIFKICSGTAHVGPVTFNYPVEQVTDQEAIREFFGAQRDFLPESIRDAISPPPRKKDPEPDRKNHPPHLQNSNRMFYYLAAFILVAGAVKLAQWTFAKPKPQPQPRPVTPQRS